MDVVDSCCHKDPYLCVGTRRPTKINQGCRDVNIVAPRRHRPENNVGWCVPLLFAVPSSFLGQRWDWHQAEKHFYLRNGCSSTQSLSTYAHRSNAVRQPMLNHRTSPVGIYTQTFDKLRRLPDRQVRATRAQCHVSIAGLAVSDQSCQHRNVDTATSDNQGTSSSTSPPAYSPRHSLFFPHP